MTIEQQIRKLAIKLENKKSYGSTDAVTLFRLYCGLSLAEAAKITIENADRCKYRSIY